MTTAMARNCLFFPPLIRRPAVGNFNPISKRPPSKRCPWFDGRIPVIVDPRVVPRYRSASVEDHSHGDRNRRRSRLSRRFAPHQAASRRQGADAPGRAQADDPAQRRPQRRRHRRSADSRVGQGKDRAQSGGQGGPAGRQDSATAVAHRQAGDQGRARRVSRGPRRQDVLTRPQSARKPSSKTRSNRIRT